MPARASRAGAGSTDRPRSASGFHGWSFVVHLVEYTAKRGHPVAPKVLVGREPVDQLGHRLSRDPVEAVPTLLALLHEPRLTQRAEVLGDAGPGHVELPGEFPGSELTVEKRVEDVTTSGVGKRAEHLVQRVGLKTARQAGRPQPCRT